MTDPVIIEMLSYWEQLRDGRAAPPRSEIDPRQIQSLLEHTFILERVRDGHPRVRLAGMAVCDLLGMELRGMPARSLIEVGSRPHFDRYLSDVMDKPQIIELYLETSDQDNEKTRGRMLLLPLTDNDGETTRVMGCITLHTKLFQAPLRFDIEDVKITRIVAGRSIEIAEPTLEFAEDQRSFERPERTTLRPVGGNPEAKRDRTSENRPKLKIVKDEE